MKTSVIRIGKSRGVRIPKALLEQCRIRGTVELEVRGGELIVRPSAKPRSGWDRAFKRMARRGGDLLVGRGSPPSAWWDETKWKW